MTINSRVLTVLITALVVCFLSCCIGYHPWATVEVKGVVVSHTDNTPIEGIRVVMKSQDDYFRFDAIYTDNNGFFNISNSGELGYFSRLYYIKLTDDKNGLFADKDVEVDFSHVRFKGDCVRLFCKVEKDLGIIKIELRE